MPWHRLRRGSVGGRPPAFDVDADEDEDEQHAQTFVKERSMIKRSFNHHTQWHGRATRHNKLPVTSPTRETRPHSRLERRRSWGPGVGSSTVTVIAAPCVHSTGAGWPWEAW